MKLERFYDFANWKWLSWNSKSGFLTLKYLLSVVQVNHSHCFWVFTYLVFTHQELSLRNFILSSNNRAQLLLPPVYPVQKFLEKPSDLSKARQAVEERWQSRESDVKAQVTEDRVTLCLLCCFSPVLEYIRHHWLELYVPFQPSLLAFVSEHFPKLLIA